MKRHYNNRQRNRSPQSEIKRLEEAIRREQDKTQRENLRQHLEHWIRTQNNHR